MMRGSYSVKPRCLAAATLCVLLACAWAPCSALEWQLTTGSDWNEGPEWCGDFIIFSSNRDPSVSMDIWVIEVDGAGQFDEIFRGTQQPAADDMEPTWEVGQCGFQYYFQRTAGSDPTVIHGANTNNPNFSFPVTLGTANDRAPDRSYGDMLVFSDRAGNRDIVAIDHGGEASGWEYLTTDPADDRSPCWSPDESWVAFASDRSGNWDIWVMSAAGEDDSLRQLTDTPENEFRPAWSPTGEYIAFDREGEGIVAVDASGRAEYQITSDHSDFSPTWNDDGSMLAFTRQTSGQQIWITDNLPPSATERRSWGRVKAMYR